MDDCKFLPTFRIEGYHITIRLHGLLKLKQHVLLIASLMLGVVPVSTVYFGILHCAVKQFVWKNKRLWGATCGCKISLYPWSNDKRDSYGQLHWQSRRIWSTDLQWSKNVMGRDAFQKPGSDQWKNEFHYIPKPPVFCHCINFAHGTFVAWWPNAFWGKAAFFIPSVHKALTYIT